MIGFVRWPPEAVEVQVGLGRPAYLSKLDNDCVPLLAASNAGISDLLRNTIDLARQCYRGYHSRHWAFALALVLRAYVRKCRLFRLHPAR